MAALRSSAHERCTRHAWELSIVSGVAGEPGAHGHSGHNLYLHLHTINEKTKKRGGMLWTCQKILSRVLTDEFSLSCPTSLIMRANSGGVLHLLHVLQVR
jgi:hypothetical protein